MKYKYLYEKPQLSLLLQILAQSFYILFTLRYAALSRSGTWLLCLYVFCMVLDFALRRRWNPQAAFFNFSVIAIANSTLVNMESYSLWALLFAGAVGMFSKAFILDERKKHIFNPSVIAVVVASVFFPAFASPAGQTWGDFYPETFVLIFFGSLATYFAGTTAVALSYFIGFAVFSGAIQYAGMALNLWPAWEIHSVYPLYWPATLLSTGSMIFILGVISDPKTAPLTRKNQILFGSGIAMVDFILRKNLILMPDLFAYMFMQGSRVFLRSWGLYSLFNPSRSEGAKISGTEQSPTLQKPA